MTGRHQGSDTDMAKTEFKNGPDLAGWAIAAGVGVVALALCMLVFGLDLTPSVAIAAVLFGVVGLILGLPRAALPPPGQVQVVTPVIGTAAPVIVPEPAVAPAAPPVAEPAMPAPPTPDHAAADPAAVAAAAAPTSAFVAMVPEATAHGPARLSAPRGGVPDDLKQIEGIGPALEQVCNDLGFYHYDQIANWSEADIAWVDDNMPRFKGRIQRDKWVAQARLIVAEGLEAFRIRAKTNDY